MSAGERTNDSATRSTPSRSANSRSVDVLLRQRGGRDVHAGQRHTFVIADRPTLGDRADDVVAVDLLDDQTDVAVVDQDPVSGFRVPGKLLVGRRHPVVGALAVIHRDPHGLAVCPIGGAGGEPSEPDLGTLQVGEDAHRMPGHIGGRADAFVGGFVIGVVTVAEVQPRDIHAGLDQCLDGLVGGCGRAEGTDDLSASSHVASA